MGGIREYLLRNITAIKWLVAVVAVVAAGFALKVGQVFFAPLVFTALAVMLVAPLQQRFDALFKGRFSALSLVLTLLAILVVLGIFIGGIWFSANSIAHRVPAYAMKSRELWLQFNAWAASHRLPVTLTGDLGGRLEQIALHSLTMIFTSLSTFVSRLGLILILLLLSLLQVRYWQAKLRTSSRATGLNYAGILTVFSQKLGHFLFIQTMINLVAGAVITAWLLVLGVDLAPVLGISAFLLEYVPIIGSLIVSFLAAMVALLQYGPIRAAAVLAGLIIIYQVNGNFITPRFQGKSVSVSPVLLILSIVFWSWLWGITGTLIALPLTVALVAASDTVPFLGSLFSIFRTNTKGAG